MTIPVAQLGLDESFDTVKRNENAVVVRYAVEVVNQLREQAGIPIHQALKSVTFYNCEPAVLEGLEGNEPYIARKFNVAEIQYKECTDEFVDMWRSLLGNSSDGLAHADVGESVGEEDGLWAEEKTIKQYQYNRDKRWVAKVVLLGTGVMVLDTKVYPDIDDMIRRRDASPYLDPASDKYFGDTQSLDRDIAGILEQPRYGDQYQTLKDLESRLQA